MRTQLLENLPLALVGGAFLLLVSATQCTQNDAGATNDTNPPTATPCNYRQDCPLPASRCVSANELHYYSSPQCESGHCAWITEVTHCPCYSGGCQGTTTASMSLAGSGGQIGGPYIDVEAGESPGLSDAAIDHALVAAPDAGSCDGDDASACAMPHSVCADDRWVAYFTNGVCQQNVCQWEVNYRDCNVRGCNAGGCILNVTK
jgi:hypothetical protein